MANCKNFPALENYITNAEHIRTMDDAQLTSFIHQLVSSDFFCRICPKSRTCIELLNNDENIPDRWCEETIVKWLRTPRDQRPNWFDEEKQESGLLEED